jgi:hypothetical protein
VYKPESNERFIEGQLPAVVCEFTARPPPPPSPVSKMSLKFVNGIKSTTVANLPPVSTTPAVKIATVEIISDCLHIKVNLKKKNSSAI